MNPHDPLSMPSGDLDHPEELTDLSLMPFGKHKGEPLQDVPASYFHWLWTEADYNIKVSDPLHHYIKKNLSALKQEHFDGIW